MQAISPPNAEVTALILCGGRGSRMGGRDKPLLGWRGARMVDHVVQRARAQAGHVLISANRNEGAYAELAEVVTDAPLESRSPLTGIARGMQVAATEWIWVCPGDTPELAEDLLARLWHARGEAAVVTAHDGTRNQWLHMLARRSLLANLLSYLEAGNRSAHGWLAQLPEASRETARCDEISNSFLNVNAPDQLNP